MTGDRDRKIQVIFDAQDAIGIGEAMEGSQYRHITVAVAGGNSANLTVKCVGSIEVEQPTWSSAASVSNQYDTIAMFELENAVVTEGDIGVVLTSDDVILYTVNVDGLQWLNFEVTARSAGDVTVKAVAYNNQ
jgi:hypothetical protein